MRLQEKNIEQITLAWDAKAEKTKTFNVTATKGKEFTIDWGDDTAIETITAKEYGQKIKHKYNEDGNYRVTITAVIADCCFTVLSCYKKEITALNLNECVSLEYLDCFSNQLTNIDLSKNKSLKEIGLSSNKLHSLDISTNVDLRHLDCSFNELISLDVRNNTKLLYLKCYYNELCDLNISSKQKLQLQYFDCRNNQLSEYGQNNNTELE